MPFYTFFCPKCNVTADELVRMGTETTECKTCGTQTEKLPSFKTVALGLPNGFASTRSKSRK